MSRYVNLRFQVDDACTDSDEVLEQQVEDFVTNLDPDITPSSWTWDAPWSGIVTKDK